MLHLDLCTGLAGFTLAAQANGCTTIGFSEIDPFLSAGLARAWPTIPNYGDIKNVGRLLDHDALGDCG